MPTREEIELVETGNQWFYLITLQWPIPGGAFNVESRRGLYTPPPGGTRLQAYLDITESFRQEPGAPATAATVFFSLEPNELSGAGCRVS